MIFLSFRDVVALLQFSTEKLELLDVQCISDRQDRTDR